MKTTKDLALGSYEAAALMGVHFTRPRLMADAGKIIARPLMAFSTTPGLVIQVYSQADCERDYREYEDRVEAAGGKHCRRPRAWLHMRPDMLKRLAKEKNKIEFSDACSVQEALNILRLSSTSQITRLATSGEIVARKVWNPRHRGGHLWIISRRSVEERKRRVVAAETAGKKSGIRKFVKKKT